MARMHLLSLLLALFFILLSNFSHSEVQAAILTVNRRLFDAGEDGNYQQYLRRKMINNRRMSQQQPSELDLLNALRKRQMIRYHPCYFNPVSCFRRK